MSSTTIQKKTDTMHRVNTRIFAYQDLFIKKLAKKLNKSEGDIHRELLDAAIKNYKAN